MTPLQTSTRTLPSPHPPPPARPPKLTASVPRFKRKWVPEEADGPTSKRRKVRPAAATPRAPPQNKAVYVTGLPLDATADEVAALFSRKCGVIAEEIDSGRPRVKLYADAAGRFKGDALVVFFKPQSVAMALTLLDGAPFRLEAAAAAGPGAAPMRVQAADASYKKTSYTEPDAAGPGANGRGGPEAAAAPPPAKERSKRALAEERAKVIRRTQKLDAKLADWSDDEDGGARAAKHERLVVLKHMFTLRDLDEGPEALLEIKEDIRDECAKLGDVTNVVLYDLEDDGVVGVRFRNVDAALACVRLMDGRAFDGRIVEASIATGKEKYRQSKEGADVESDG